MVKFICCQVNEKEVLVVPPNFIKTFLSLLLWSVCGQIVGLSVSVCFVS